MKFGEYVRNSREEQNLSLREAARRAGISHPYLSQLETGKNTKPTPEVIKKIADGLKLNYIELLEIAGYLEEAEKEALVKSANEYRKHREKQGLEDISILNEKKFIFDDIKTGAHLNTEFIYSGELLDFKEKMPIANLLDKLLINREQLTDPGAEEYIDNLLTIVFKHGIPVDKDEKMKSLTVFEALIKKGE